MDIAKIKYCSIGNWKGISTSLYVSGCCHRCKGCFQPETWNPNYGHKWEEIDKQMIIDSLHPKHITGLVLLGGEPFMQYNIPELVQLCKEVVLKLLHLQVLLLIICYVTLYNWS